MPPRLAQATFQPVSGSICPTNYEASRPFGYGNATKPPSTGKPPRPAQTTIRPMFSHSVDVHKASQPSG
jgi:hypothetical protein